MKEFKKEKSRKLQAASLTISLGYCKIVFYCNVKLNYLLQRLTSFSVFPVDKFAKALLEPWSYLTVCFYKSCTMGPGVR